MAPLRKHYDYIVIDCAPSLNHALLLPSSMVDRRKALHHLIVGTPPKMGLTGTLNAYIPFASEVEKMGLRRAPINACTDRAHAAQTSKNLCYEIKQRLEKPELPWR